MILLLILLFTKHLICDFYLQTDTMVKHKGIWGDWRGFLHSLIQGVGTFVCLIWFIGPSLALILSILDCLTHYVIDWTKMNYGCPDITKRTFWNHIGLDQWAHHMIYIYIYSVAT